MDAEIQALRDAARKVMELHDGNDAESVRFAQKLISEDILPKAEAPEPAPPPPPAPEPATEEASG